MQPHEMNQDYQCPFCESKTPQLVVANGKDILMGFQCVVACNVVFNLRFPILHLRKWNISIQIITTYINYQILPLTK